MAPNVTITRGELLVIADDAIRQIDDLAPSHAELLREAARTAETVLFGGWVRGDCGCLVGIAFPEAAFAAEQTCELDIEAIFPDGVYDVGVEFDVRLGIVTGLTGLARFERPIPVRVMSDGPDATTTDPAGREASPQPENPS